MIKVRPRGNESIQQTLRRFRKILEKEGVVKDIKKRMYYESPSEKRRRIKRKRKRDQEKISREENMDTPKIK